jgi:hypothetical protein
LIDWFQGKSPETPSSDVIGKKHAKTLLVGGIPTSTPLKNHGVRQWVSDDIPYMKWTIKFHGLKPPISQLW